MAGATQWYNAASPHPVRTTYTRTVTNGTVGVVDHEDAHTVTVVPLLYADKAAVLQVDSMSPGIVDPGDVLRYTIRIYNNGQLARDRRRAARQPAGEHDVRSRLAEAERPAPRCTGRRCVAAASPASP